MKIVSVKDKNCFQGDANPQNFVENTALRLFPVENCKIELFFSTPKNFIFFHKKRKIVENFTFINLVNFIIFYATNTSEVIKSNGVKSCKTEINKLIVKYHPSLFLGF